MYLQGLMARVFQHEISHFDGHTIWDAPQFKENSQKINAYQVLDTMETSGIDDDWIKDNEKYLLVY